MDELKRQLAAFSKAYGEKGKEMAERIQALLDSGMDPKKAIAQVFEEYDMVGWLDAEVSDVIVNAAQDALGEELTSQISAASLLEALSTPWSKDKLTLSQKLHGAEREMRQAIGDTIQEQIRRNASVKKTANALFDGYNAGKVIKQQKLPKYMDNLMDWTRRSRDNLTEKEQKDLQKAIRQVRAQADGLMSDGASYNHFRTSLYELLDKVNKGSEKAVQKAVSAAIQEKSRYIAERIARTEGARARYEAFRARYDADDSVVAYQWKLGSRHPDEDICDMYAGADLYGLGAGVYPKDRVPDCPAHPNCLCHLTPIYESELKGKHRSDNVEENGDAWLEKQPLHVRQSILGVKGEKEWQEGRLSWTEKAETLTTAVIKNEPQKSGLFDLILQLHGHQKVKEVSRPSAFDDPDVLIIPKEKFTDYCLNPEHLTGKYKALVFNKVLGYTKNDYKKLEDLIRNNILDATFTDHGINNHGHGYGAKFWVKSLKGEDVLLQTGWFVDKGAVKPRLTTAYLKLEVKKGAP